jgi:hypothetical protein
MNSTPPPPVIPLPPRRRRGRSLLEPALRASRADYEASISSDDRLVDRGAVAWLRHCRLQDIAAVNPALAHLGALAMGGAS